MVPEADDLQLSSFALQALKEFYKEQKEEQERFLALNVAAESNFEQNNAPTIKIHDFKEDWQMSQFWYTDETSAVLANEIIEQAKKLQNCAVACLCAPSVFSKLKELSPNLNTFLFEYDKRFSAFGSDFVFFDYKNPESFAALPQELAKQRNVAENLRQSFDIIIADPPFLSEECWVKVTQTISYLAKPSSEPSRTGSRIIVCTGAIMQALIEKQIPAHESESAKVFVSGFYPQHQNGLSNEFRCFLNYSDSIGKDF